MTGVASSAARKRCGVLPTGWARHRHDRIEAEVALHKGVGEEGHADRRHLQPRGAYERLL